MPLPQEARYTLADALTWDEQDHIELIDGYPVMMAPPTRAHQKAVAALTGQFYDYLKGKKCEVYPAPFAVRPFEQNSDSPEDVDTMVIEILSPSTQRHDRLTKFNLYQRAGVREYWIIDTSSKSVQVFVLEDGRFTAKDFGTAGDKLKVNVLEDCTIDLAEVFLEG